MALFREVKIIEESDFSQLVEKTYERPYKFQQQKGCQPRGIVTIQVPAEDAELVDDSFATSIPVELNGTEIGVKWQVWLDTPVDHFDLVVGGSG